MYIVLYEKKEFSGNPPQGLPEHNQVGIYVLGTDGSLWIGAGDATEFKWSLSPTVLTSPFRDITSRPTAIGQKARLLLYTLFTYAWQSVVSDPGGLYYDYSTPPTGAGLSSRQIVEATLGWLEIYTDPETYAVIHDINQLDEGQVPGLLTPPTVEGSKMKVNIISHRWAGSNQSYWDSASSKGTLDVGLDWVIGNAANPDTVAIGFALKVNKSRSVEMTAENSIEPNRTPTEQDWTLDTVVTGADGDSKWASNQVPATYKWVYSASDPGSPYQTNISTPPTGLGQKARIIVGYTSGNCYFWDGESFVVDMSYTTQESCELAGGQWFGSNPIYEYYTSAVDQSVSYIWVIRTGYFRTISSTEYYVISQHQIVSVRWFSAEISSITYNYFTSVITSQQDVYEYYNSAAGETHWEFIAPASEEDIGVQFKVLMNNVKYSVTQRTFDKDTSQFEGVCEMPIEDPFIFVLKDEDGNYMYSGYIEAWNQKGNYAKFKGVDFKSIFDTEIQLDFYTEQPEVNLRWHYILNQIFLQFAWYNPRIYFYLPDINPDTTMISNLWGSKITINVLKLLKTYLGYYGYRINSVFNEVTKKIEISIIKNTATSKLLIEDFEFEGTKTSGTINHAVALLKDPRTYEDEALSQWIPSTEQYFFNKNENDRETAPGFMIDNNNFIVLGSTWSDYVLSSFSGDHYLEIRLTEAILNKIVAWTESGKPTYWFWIPQDDLFMLDVKVPFSENYKSRIGIGVLNPISDVLLKTARYPENVNGGKDLYLQDHSYTDFGQGWFEGYFAPTSSYIRIRISLKSAPPPGFAAKILSKVIIANPNVVRDKNDFFTYTNQSIENHSWYLRPLLNLESEDGIPYGHAVKTTDGIITKFWQLGRVTRQPKIMPMRDYYLGANNEVYEKNISELYKMYPVKTKIFEDEFFHQAQFNAVSELVNSRFNENVDITDDGIINPMTLAQLGLYAQIDVTDKNGVTRKMPISEIQRNNKEIKVKLGFKKTLFTEIIKR